MIQRRIQITNLTGLHLRPAHLLCKKAAEFDCMITMQHQHITADVKSLLSVLGACVRFGDEIEMRCDGTDEEIAMETLVALIESGLGE